VGVVADKTTMTPVGFDKFHGEVFNGPRVDSDPSALGPRLPALPPTFGP